MNNRIAAMRAQCLATKPELLTDRVQLVTDSYRQTSGQPAVLQRALALKNIMEKMGLYIGEQELFVGNPSPALKSPMICPEFGANWILAEMDRFGSRESDPILVSDENKAILVDCLSFWKDCSLDHVVAGVMPRRSQQAIDDGVITVGGTGQALGNISMNYEKLLHKGLNGIIAELDEKITGFKPEDIADFDKLSFWRAAKISCQAVIHFAERYAENLRSLAAEARNPDRQAEQHAMAQVLDTVPAAPARTFREALQSLWLVYVAAHIESDPHAILLGRFDQYMYPFYSKDLEEGRITTEEARELLECLWIKCTGLIKLRDEESSKDFAGFPLFQNVTIGGQTSSGEDASNDLSLLMLEAAASVKVSQPSIGLRYHNKLSDELLLKSCEVIREGLGYPAIMNDDCIIPKQLVRGSTLEEARDYCNNCVETEIPGMTDSRPHSGYVNFPKCLLLALNDGVDPETAKQVGPQTGKPENFSGFEDLMTAYNEQVRYFVERIVEAYDLVDSIHAAVAPEPFISVFVEDCIAAGKTRQAGGARYNHSGIFGVGLANVANSLAAVKMLVFEQRKYAAQKILDALSKDYAGAEALQKELLHKVPKYGTDDDYVDAIACDCSAAFCDEVISHPCIRGGTYIPELHTVSTHVTFGEKTGATPDGRKAGEAFADGISPVAGSDMRGPTAAVKSITKIDHQKVLQGLLFNQKFHPTALSGRDAIRKFADYIKVFCGLGGHHIQFNIVSPEVLKEAQLDPLKYRDLVVRVAGYSAFFADLNVRGQNEIICRTEQGNL